MTVTRIIVAGGTGFLGRPLCDTFAAAGHEVLVLTRHLSAGPVFEEAAPGHPGVHLLHWDPAAPDAPWRGAIGQADAVVNLAGEPLTAHRWTDTQKKRILDSRVVATAALADAIAVAPRPPRVFVTGSAIGYYGDRGSDVVTEADPPGHDFLARVCEEWEHAADPAKAATRVVRVRTGIVLERHGGALGQMLLPFRLGVGGPIGSGRQFMSWIHRRDWTRLIGWAIETPSVSGPLNATAPAPVDNATFSRALGRVLHRPAWVPVPAFGLRVLFGELADTLLASQRVVPAAAQAAGFRFEFQSIDDALAAIFSGSGG